MSLGLDEAGTVSYKPDVSFYAVCGWFFEEENEEYILSRGGFFVLWVAGFTAKLFLSVVNFALVVFVGVGGIGALTLLLFLGESYGFSSVSFFKTYCLKKFPGAFF